MNRAIRTIRQATMGTRYEGLIYIVGGALRDRALGMPMKNDVDLVLEEDALELAQFLFAAGHSQHHPVLYPRFGTAKVQVDDCEVELVTARAESYDRAHRKPSVRKSTLEDDAFRRDFTVNTLMENLHTGEALDLTGHAQEDMKLRILRTPLDPHTTFFDDPLRMLRAVRFATRLNFEIEPVTLSAIKEEAHRLNLLGPDPAVVSAERIRDEFLKIVDGPDPVRGIELLLELDLLRQFFPELIEMVGVTQNDWHQYDVWAHTMKTVKALPSDVSLEVKLGMLLHDVGKPRTRTVDDRGVHFYQHQFVGAKMAQAALSRLKCSHDLIHQVTALVELHMRIGEYREEWSTASIRRLMRDTDGRFDDLLTITRADFAGMRSDIPVTNFDGLTGRINEQKRLAGECRFESPLDGQEIIQHLNIVPGRLIGEAKQYLTEAVVEGRLQPGDKIGAYMLLTEWNIQND